MNLVFDDNQEMKRFLYKFRRMLTIKNVTQEELAKMIGVSRITINRYYTGESIPNILTMVKITKALDWPLEDFSNREIMKSEKED